MSLRRLSPLKIIRTLVLPLRNFQDVLRCNFMYIYLYIYIWRGGVNVCIYIRAKAGWPARTYIQQLCEDTGCCFEDLPRAMNDREEWRQRVRDICATSTTWWWWWWWWYWQMLTFLTMVPKHDSTNGKGEWNAVETILRKNY